MGTGVLTYVYIRRSPTCSFAYSSPCARMTGVLESSFRLPPTVPVGKILDHPSFEAIKVGRLLLGCVMTP